MSDTTPYIWESPEIAPTVTPELCESTVLPKDFDARTYVTIPAKKYPIFPTGTVEQELMARHLIRMDLTKRLGVPVIALETANSKAKLTNSGFTLQDIQAGKVAVR
jgi:hypothetical protein